METTASAIAQMLALPSGSGAPSGLGERFQPDLFKGSGAYAIPIALPPGPNHLQPQLSLRYSTGGGDGPCGVGWQLVGPLSIARRLDRGTPSYRDDDELVLGGADLLVAVGAGRYRPRTERAWLDIRRDGDGWKIRTKEGKTILLGTTAESRVAHAGRVLSWHAEREIDAADNQIRWRYQHDRGHLYLTGVEWSRYAVAIAYEDRPDPSTDGRAGFVRTLARRCTRIDRRCESLATPLLGRHSLRYDQDPLTGASRLAGFETIGVGDGGDQEAGATLGFAYTTFEPRAVPRALVLGDAPQIGGATALVDLDGDGRPELVDTTRGRQRAWPNRGDGRFGPPRALPTASAGIAVGNRGAGFVDVDGDGAIDLIQIARDRVHAFRNRGDGGWEARPIVARTTSGFDPGGAVRFADLDGDGVTDVVAGRLWARAEAAGGWGRLRPILCDPADPPPIDLRRDDVRLADLTGDGLPDVVVVASGRVDYWPSLGAAGYAARVRMSDPPILPARCDLRRLFVVDVDGDGRGDLVYVDRDGATVWFNRQGRSWSPGHPIRFAGPSGGDDVELVDLLGSGVIGVAWRDRYVELGRGRAHLMTAIDHGTGARSELTYEVYAATAARGDHLPFPLHVVTRIRDVDRITGAVSETRMRYAGATYDGLERELRGFARVEVESELGHGFAVSVQTVEFAVGATTPAAMRRQTLAERARDRALAGALLTSTTAERDGDRMRVLESTRCTWIARDEAPGVIAPLMTVMETRGHADGQRDRVLRIAYQHDRFGNVIERDEQRGFGDAGGGVDVTIARVQRVELVTDEARWLVGLPVRITSRDGAGVLCADARHYYDGPAFVGEPAGHATRGVVRRSEELAIARDDLPAGYLDAIDPAWGYRVDPDGLYRTTFAAEHDARGNAIALRDPVGRVTGFTFDDDGVAPRRAVHPDGTVTEIELDPRLAKPRHARLPTGGEVRYRYSPLGTLIAQEELDEAGQLQLMLACRMTLADVAASPPAPSCIATFRPRVAGLAIDQVLAGGEHLDDCDAQFEYHDGRGRRIQRTRRVEGPAGAGWIADLRREYAGDHPIADLPNVVVSDPGYRAPAADEPRTRFTIDGLGRKIAAGLPDGRETRIELGTERVRRLPLAAGDGEARVEHVDAAGMIVAVEEPAGTPPRAAAELDVQSRPRTLLDGSGRTVARYRYTAFGPPITIDHADGGARVYWYDAAGALRRRSHAGATLRFELDDGARVTRISELRGDTAVEVRRFTYERTLMTTAIDGEVEVAMGHDRAGRRRSVRWRAPGIADMTVEYEYDLQGEGIAVRYPDGTRVATERGLGGRPLRVPGVVDAITYDAHDRMTRMELVGGFAIDQEHDPITHWLSRATLGSASGVVRETRWEHTLGGDIAAIEDGLAGRRLRREFGYDPRGRLARADAIDPGGAATEYAYDDADNLIAGESVRPAVVRDAAGQAATLGDVTLGWDVWGRLVEARRGDGVTVRWRYDFNGNPVTRETSDAGGTRVVALAGGLYERHADHERLNLFVDAAPLGYRIARGGETRTIATLIDPHGSPLAGVVIGGGVAFQCAYSPYGTAHVLDGGGGDDAARWFGKPIDLGLIILGRRVYAPALGQFLSPDWYAIETPQRALLIPASLCAYAYALDNPLRYRDPGGAWFGWDDLIVAGIGFVVGFVVGAYLANKRGDSWLLGGLEGGLVGAAGAWLGYNCGAWVFSKAGWAPGWLLGKVGIHVCISAKALAITGAIIGGLNGVICGSRQIYNWSNGTGELAFLSDSTWSLLGTGLGLLLMCSASGYVDGLSRRQNHQVYDGGFGFDTFAFTQGNVTTNMRGRRSDLADHEGWHSWESRIFGPAFQESYVAWFVVGGLIGVGLGTFIGDQGVVADFQDVGYFDNPWELWSYAIGGDRKGGDLA